MVWPRRPVTAEMLAETRGRLSQRDFETAWQDGEGLTLDEIVAID